MTRFSTGVSGLVSGLGLALLLAACGGDPKGNGHGNGHDGAHEGNAHSGEAHSSGAAMDMHEAMASAVGADVSDTWVRKMIAHHEGAIAMADEAAARSKDPRVVAIARRMAAAQRSEIEEMRRLIRKDAAPDPASARPYAQSEKRMHDAMMAAGATDPSQGFLRGMIPHHEGAVAMSKIVLAQGRDERVNAIARRIVADQEKEIAEMKAMLGEGPAR